MTYFYRDGNNTSFAESLKIQVLAADGTWIDASDDVPVGTEGAPVVDVPVSVAATSAVRVVMTARPSGYVTGSEIEVYVKTPGVSADASLLSIEVDGEPVPDFAPYVTGYEIVTSDPCHSLVTATPSDPYAKVTVTREECSRDTRRVVIAVTSEDGTAQMEYQVETTPWSATTSRWKNKEEKDRPGGVGSAD